MMTTADRRKQETHQDKRTKR
jgi:hypothetical protein